MALPVKSIGYNLDISRNEVAKLYEDRDLLQAQVQVLREALAWYAENNTFVHEMALDNGQRARKALEKVGES